MKGFYIFESESHKEAVDCFELGNIVQSHRLEFAPGTITEEVKMQALVSKETKTKCSPEDTYDFETGALIALMKMCGLEKSAKAYAEIFDDTAYGDALIERDKLKGENSHLKYVISCRESAIESLENTRDLLINKNNELIEENKRLKAEKDLSWKNYQRKIQKKQDRINELNNIEEGYIKLREEYDSLFEENEKLQHEYNLCLNSENALKYTVDSLNKSVDKLNKAIVGYKNDLYNTAKRCKELERGYKASNDDEAKLVEYYQREIKKLEAENEKLKLDCEKLQHGYIGTDMIFCGRSCGKQYKALVELFKKIDQKKVDEAYKEAYDTTLPVWQKEALRQAYEIRIESKEKTELPRTLDINGTVYRKSIQIKDFGEQINKLTVDSLIEQNKAFTRKCVDEWLYKIPTKREEMWGEILELHKTNDVIIEVKKEDVNTFLHEIENRIPEIRWASWQKIFEAKGTIKNIYEELKTHDMIYFRLSKETTLSYSSDPHIYPYRELKPIDYLPPMRWDLFKKGRLAVKVDYDNYKEFYEACEKELGKRPVTAVFTEDFTVSICKKDGLFEIFTVEDQKKTGRKIVNWEDVK